LCISSVARPIGDGALAAQAQAQQSAIAIGSVCHRSGRWRRF
jgi:hypothetical protein